MQVAVFHRALYFVDIKILGISSRAERTAAKIYGIRTGTYRRKQSLEVSRRS